LAGRAKRADVAGDTCKMWWFTVALVVSHGVGLVGIRLTRVLQTGGRQLLPVNLQDAMVLASVWHEAGRTGRSNVAREIAGNLYSCICAARRLPVGRFTKGAHIPP